MRSTTETTRWICGLFVCSALLVAMPSIAGDREVRAKVCDEEETLWVWAGETVRSPGGTAGHSERYAVEVPSAGILALEVSTPGAKRLPRIIWRGAAEGRAQAVKLTATSTVLEVTAGLYLLDVALEDRRQALTPYKLRTTFAEAAAWRSKGENDDELDPDIDPSPFAATGKGEDDGQLDPDIDPSPFTASGKGEHDDELEPDVDPLMACPAGYPTKGEHDGEIDPDIDPQPLASGKGEHDDDLEPEIDPQPLAAGKGECDGELEPDIDPLPLCGYDLTARSEAVRRAVDALCAARFDADDHGDGFLCATPLKLGRAAGGTLGNGWGDDEDVFRFRLDRPRTVVIESRGETATTAALYDRFGNRLDHAEAASGAKNGVRLARTLNAGTYFVRVSGRDAAGPYEIAVAAGR